MVKPNRVYVSNMISHFSGKKVANQFEITTDDGIYFQSYKHVIAFVPFDSSKPTLLDYAHNLSREESQVWSMTTSKYRKQFLGADNKETRERIKQGHYQLAELN